MIVNETTFYQSSNELDGSNSRQSHGLRHKKNAYLIVGYKNPRYEKCETI